MFFVFIKFLRYSYTLNILVKSAIFTNLALALKSPNILYSCRSCRIFSKQSFLQLESERKCSPDEGCVNFQELFLQFISMKNPPGFHLICLYIQETNQCECAAGFVGVDCGTLMQPDKYEMQLIKNSTGSIAWNMQRIGSSMVKYGNELYVFGGTNLTDDPSLLMIKFDYKNNEWGNVSIEGEERPSMRSLHCAFAYQVSA